MESPTPVPAGGATMMDPPAPVPAPPPSSRSWSIYGRAEITQRYEILGRVGSGAYSDVYRGRRITDGAIVALKEIHDYQSAFREIEALQVLRNAPNVIELLEYFWHEDEDAVLVLEFLATDLSSVVRDAKKNGGVAVAEVKQWMLQMLRGVEACHGSSVVHRDLKPSNLLISADGVLKLADFGQSRVLQEPKFIYGDVKPVDEHASNEAWAPLPIPFPQGDLSWHEPYKNQNVSDSKAIHEENYFQEVSEIKSQLQLDETVSLQDGNTSCLATCSTGDVEDDPFKGSYSYETYEGAGVDDSGELTSCVGTRWFRAPELLYGSTSYGHEIDLWSLGCVFAELINLNPLFPGISDIDQLGRIISTLGNITEENWPACSNLPDYGKISFNKVENPTGLESFLPNRSPSEVSLVKQLVCYDPMRRSSAAELLHNSYFSEEPLPAPLSELKVPAKSDEPDESSPGQWGDSRDMDSDSDQDSFGNVDISTTEKGFSVRFS